MRSVSGRGPGSTVAAPTVPPLALPVLVLPPLALLPLTVLPAPVLVVERAPPPRRPEVADEVRPRPADLPVDADRRRQTTNPATAPAATTARVSADVL
ncbi:hypothetical protein [Micromonospora zamorensis]|uniref:hypothetical protein n=1 Tax=Micromonospora zamorensis TaxID=709883 RepID=UPI0037AEC826